MSDNQQSPLEIAFTLMEEISLFRAVFDQNGCELKLGQAELSGAVRVFDRWVRLTCDLTECLPRTDEAVDVASEAGGAL